MKKKVLITRALDQAGEFAALLEKFGFLPLIFPTIEFAPPEDTEKVAKTLRNISSFDWVLLTSANAVRFFIQSLEKVGKPALLLKDIKVCAVGPKTAEAAENFGLIVNLIPDDYRAEGVLHALAGVGIEGKKILFPRAGEGRDLLPNGLKELGANVELLPLYRTAKPAGKSEELITLLSQGVDFITFTSGSTVKNFLSMLGEKNLHLLDGARVACISEVTAQTAASLGIQTDILPAQNTTRSLAEAISNSLS
ncbi:MAG: uroporphyrinogen-III synthase [bacterium]|nr:uroporphyrinogen-III synthase [bacterium]